MLDVLMIAVTIGFFAACLAYTAGCQRLLERTAGNVQAESRNER
jgi:hypothetical protein